MLLTEPLQRQQQPAVMPRSYPEFVRLLNDAIKRYAGGNKSEFARQIGRSPALVNQMSSGSSRGGRDTIEIILARFPEEDRDAWMLAAGYGNTTPEDERHLIARAAAEEAVRRLLEEIRIVSPSDRIVDWLKSIQERYGRTVEIHFSGGASTLTHAEVDSLIAYHEARIKREGWEPVAPKDDPLLTNGLEGER